MGRRKYKIKCVGKIVDGHGNSDYGGMNYFAAHDPAVNMRYPYDKNTILIVRGQPDKLRKETILHEKVEAEIMRNTQIQYPKAHRATTKFETKLGVRSKFGKKKNKKQKI